MYNPLRSEASLHNKASCASSLLRISKKYGITADEVKKKLEEVGKYLDEDVVPDKEYKNQYL